MQIMQKVKTNSLIGAALDWAVAKCEVPNDVRDGRSRYSSDWAQGGPIIAREQISFDNFKGHPCAAFMGNHARCEFRLWAPEGQILIAAMRCYVASRFGDEIEVPIELI